MGTQSASVEKMLEAKMECEKLIERINEAMDRAMANKTWQQEALANGSHRLSMSANLNHYRRAQDTAAVKRQSMEVTRSLARLRRYG